MSDAIGAILKHNLVFEDSEKKQLQMSFTHLVGSFCGINNMIVVVCVEETGRKNGTHSMHVFESDCLESKMKTKLECQDHNECPHQLLVKQGMTQDDDSSVAVLIPIGNHKGHHKTKDAEKSSVNEEETATPTEDSKEKEDLKEGKKEFMTPTEDSKNEEKKSEKQAKAQ